MDCASGKLSPGGAVHNIVVHKVVNHEKILHFRRILAVVGKFC